MENYFDPLGYKQTLKPAAENVLHQFKDILPEFLLEEWQRHGFASYMNGLLITTDPNDFYDVLEDWVDDAQNCHVIMRTAFGCFYYLHNAQYYSKNVFHYISSDLGNDFTITMEFSLLNKMTQKESLQQPIFNKAAKRLGPPAYDEVYAFVPAIALGGNYDPATIKKVKLKEHLAFLAQLY